MSLSTSNNNIYNMSRTADAEKLRACRVQALRQAVAWQLRGMPTCGEHTSLAILGAQQDGTRCRQGQASAPCGRKASAKCALDCI